MDTEFWKSGIPQISGYCKFLACVQTLLSTKRAREHLSWMKNPCSGHVDFPQICRKASDWTVLYLNNI